MASMYVQLIHTDLPDEQAAELRAMFTKSVSPSRPRGLATT